MLSRISSRELTEWQAFFLVEEEHAERERAQRGLASTAAERVHARTAQRRRRS